VIADQCSFHLCFSYSHRRPNLALQDHASSADRISSTTSGMAPSALYSLDLAPRALIGSGTTASNLGSQYTESLKQTTSKVKKGQLALSTKYTCDMSPAELLNGFCQHRAKSAQSSVDYQPYG
jgi:hypothetical protein